MRPALSIIGGYQTLDMFTPTSNIKNDKMKKSNGNGCARHLNLNLLTLSVIYPSETRAVLLFSVSIQSLFGAGEMR